MKKRLKVTALMFGGLIGMSVIGAQSISASGQYGVVNSVQDRVAVAQSRFEGSKKSDKVLRVGSDYLQGEMVVTNLDGSKTYYNSETDPNSITVADVRRIEVEKAESIDSILSESLRDKNPRFPDVPTKPKGLGTGTKYESGYFNGGKGWEFAGYKFYNLTGAKNMTWYTFGDVARAGDMADARLQKANPTGTYGIQLNPGVPQGVYPTDGGIYTTYYSWRPATGSYYKVVGQ